LTLTALPPVIDRQTAMQLTLGWQLDTATASQSTLSCEREHPDLIWFEAEGFNDRHGWIVDRKYVIGWSGDGYLADTPNSAYAGVTLDIQQPGTYQLWVRSYRRQADDFFATIEIGDQSYSFADIQPPILNTWRWEWLGTLTLDTGPLLMRISRPFDLSSRFRYIALFVDTVLFSADPAFDPSHVDRWNAALQIDEADMVDQKQGRFDFAREPGRYRCAITVSDGDRLVDASGAIGIRSDPIEFEVRP
jgi:hypothetical protein